MNLNLCSISCGLTARFSSVIHCLAVRVARSALLLLLALPLAASATGWVARHHLTPQEYQNEFNTWSGKGLRLKNVTGYLLGAETRYAALWDDEPGPAQGAVHGVTSATVATLDAQNNLVGFEPSWVSVYPEGGALRYAVIWENSSSDRLLRLGRTAQQFAGDVTQLEASGYQMYHLSATTLNGTDYYAAVWQKTGRVSLLQKWFYRQTGAEAQASFNTWTGNGYRLVSMFGYEVGGQERFVSMYRKVGGEEWWSYRSMSSSNYQTETENAYYQGYRTAFVGGYSAGGQAQFNAIWVKNGGWSGECTSLVEKGMLKYMVDNETPGISLAIMRNGRLVYAKGFGYADKENGLWAGPLNRFRIASISKSLTATAVLKLVEANKFKLGDGVFGAGKVLGTQYGNGNYSTREKAITMRHLLTHTTGWTSDGPMWDNAYGVNHEAIMDWTLDSNEPSFAPGTRYQYMNLDYHALGRVIENYSGQSYEAYVKSAVLEPCGISQMELGNQTKGARKSREVIYYDVDGGDPYGEINPKRMDANGGWISTSIDLLQFLRRIDGESFPSDILNQTSRNEMRDYSFSVGNGYGLGWFDAGGGSEGHNGCMTGTSSFLVHRNTGTSYAVLANKRTGCSWQLKQAVDAVVAQLEAKNEWPSYDLFPVPSSSYLKWIKSVFAVDLSSGDLDLGLLERFAPYADPDNDRLANISEAFFGTDPNVANRGSQISAADEGLEVVFRWKQSTEDLGVDAKILWSSDLKSWRENIRLVPTAVGRPVLNRQAMEIRVPHTSARLFMTMEFSAR